jgi:hypothetical protein
VTDVVLFHHAQGLTDGSAGSPTGSPPQATA